jgi:hypothetical protein
MKVIFFFPRHYGIYFSTNFWLYKIFSVFNWWQVVLYQVLVGSSNYFFYFVHFPLNRLFHGPETQKTTEDDIHLEKSTVSQKNGLKYRPIGNKN